MTFIGWIILIIIVVLVVPELLVLVVTAVYMFLEFILRLFGKSFEK